MNTNDNTRPIGYWITAVDRLMKAEFATVFADEGITRRDWRMLNVIDGTAPARVAGRPMRGPKMRRLIELGWIERAADDTTADGTPAGGWALTEAGRLAKTRLSASVDELRSRVAAAVSPEEYAALTASLEKIATEFGWDEGKPLPRRHGHGHGRVPVRGHGHGHGRGYGFHHGYGHGFHHGHGFGADSGQSHDFDAECGRGAGHGHAHGRGHGRRHGHPHRGHKTETHIRIHTH